MSRSRAPLILTVIGWVGIFTTALLYLALGIAIDHLHAGRTPPYELALAALTAAALAGTAAALAHPLGAVHQGRIENEVRRAVVRTALRLGPTRLTGTPTGSITSTAIDAGERVGLNRGTFTGPALASVTSPLLVAAVIASIDTSVALCLLLAALLPPLALTSLHRVFRTASTNYRASARRLAAAFLDSVQGLTTLRLLRAGERRTHELAAAAEEVRRNVMRMLLGNQLVILVGDTVFWLGFVGVGSWLAADGVAAGWLSPGEGVAVVLLSTLMLDPLDRVGQFFYIGMAGRAAEREVAALVRRGDLIEERADRGTPEITAHGIAVDFEEVSFTYPGSDQALLDRATLHIPAGARVALVGRSGAGKSTSTDLIQGLWLPDSGHIRLGGVATTDLSVSSVRALVAVVSQRTYLFTGTLAENLRLARPDASEGDLWAALETAALAEEVRSMPAGLHTQVGERGLSLSGGQAQRVAIARAVLREAPLLILDEPTASIDAAAEHAVLEALARASLGRTVLVVTHRHQVLEHVTQVVRLDEGLLLDTALEAA